MPTFRNANIQLHTENLHHSIIFNDGIFLCLFFHHFLPCRIQSFNCLSFYNEISLQSLSIELRKLQMHMCLCDLRSSEEQNEHAMHDSSFQGTV